MLVNADFRLFVQDVTTVGRQIFSDTAFSLSEASEQVGKDIQPSQDRTNAIQSAGADEQGRKPSTEDLQKDATQIAETAESGFARTEQKAVDSAKEHLDDQTRGTLLYRLKQVVTKLRERSDYSDSVETLANLVREYVRAYVSIAEETSAATQEDVSVNADLKEAVRQFWVLVKSVGNARIWEDVHEKFDVLVQHARRDPEFENLMTELGHSVQKMLTDPSFFDTASSKIDELNQRTKKLGTESNLGEDVVAFLIQANRAVEAVAEDPAVSKLTNATTQLCRRAYGGFLDRKSELPTDVIQVFLPILLRYIQYIPILRLEIAAPEVDLLIENLVLEPGRTVNYSSFLPYRTHITTRNDVDILKRHSKRTSTGLKTTFTATVHGLNISSSEFGYWVRTHTGIFRLHDEGMASFYLDRRGIDISLDVEVGRDRLDQIFTLRGVRVIVHKLDYKIHRGKWRFFFWLAKPFLKHMLRRMLEKKIAQQIVASSNALNRELVFARERLRAARIASPKDLVSFVRAVIARMQPGPSDSDLKAGFGVDTAGHGIFRDVYAPGSIIKVWQDEVQRAQENIEEGDESRSGLGRTWRNEIFDARGGTRV